jgi:hypothetical protein
MGVPSALLLQGKQKSSIVAEQRDALRCIFIFGMLRSSLIATQNDKLLFITHANLQH